MVMEFNQNKYKQLFFRRTNTVYNYIMGENCLSISFEGKYSEACGTSQVEHIKNVGCSKNNHLA